MYTAKKLDRNVYEITISVSKDEFEKYVEHSYEENKGKFSIEGFRKGKAPRAIIEKNYGSTVFYDDAIDHLFSHEYTNALDNEKEIVPVAHPEIRIDKFDDDGIVLVATVQSIPDVKLGAYKGLEIKKATGEVTDEQVEKELNQARERQARYVEIEREAKDSDFVVIDFTGFVDGKEFEGGKAEDYRLKLGSHTFIEGFEDQVVGMKVGEERDVNVTFPEEYFSENLKGKKAVFKVKLNKVEEKVLPEVDDEFASNVSEFETLAEYKADIRKHLQENLDAKLKREDENSIIETIVKSSEIEIPEVMVENQLDEFIQDFGMRLSYQGYKLEDYLSQMKLTEKDLRDERREQATETVKTRLVLEEIVKQEKLDVTDAELDEKLKTTAEKYHKSLEEYKNNLGERNISYMKNDILMNKLLTLLTENNKLI